MLSMMRRLQRSNRLDQLFGPTIGQTVVRAFIRFKLLIQLVGTIVEILNGRLHDPTGWTQLSGQLSVRRLDEHSSSDNATCYSTPGYL